MIKPEQEVQRVRAEVAHRFLRGRGVEIGAGSRPFPLPPGTSASHGDIRGVRQLTEYFHGEPVPHPEFIDAQTFAGWPEECLDFVISAHVIEHLRDPVGALRNTLRVLRPGAILLLVVPDMRHTFDQRRPETTVEHALRDYDDGGASTTVQAYEEHLRYVHPFLTGNSYTEDEIRAQADAAAARWQEYDIHFHAWTREGFTRLLEVTGAISPFGIEETISVVNENIFVLRKKAAA